MGLEEIKIMLVDDHTVVRSGLCRLLENQKNIKVVQEADSGEVAYYLYSKFSIDVILMDLSMPGMGGLESARRILGRYPAAKVIVFFYA